MSAIVQTVLGDVHPSALGRTLTHEHLSMDFTHFYKEPPKEIADKFQSGFSLENVGFHRQYPYSSKNNLIFNDLKAKEAVLNDVLAYKKYGGGTIVENTTEGIKRDIDFCKQLSEKSKVHIVAGTGYYIADVQNNSTMGSTAEDMYNHMLKEMTEGCVDYPTVKSGFVGEIASVWPIKEFERKAIKAAGELQSQIGCGVSFHPHREPESPFEIIRLYSEAGGKMDKVVMSHLDRTLLDFDKLAEFSELGTYCQFDLFGVEVSFYQLHVPTDMPSDAQRMNMIKGLVDDGKENRILMSHDVHTKHRLIDFGGHGYCHIFNNILPRMTAKGFSQAQIDKITIENPAEWLTIKK